jgi:hypothetical protein
MKDRSDSANALFGCTSACEVAAGDKKSKLRSPCFLKFKNQIAS